MKIHDFLLSADMKLLKSVTSEMGLDSNRPDVADTLGQSSYFYTFFFLPGRYVTLLGHPPQARIAEALAMTDGPSKLAMAQVEMHGPGTEYSLWDFQGRVATFSLDTALETALRSAGWLPAGG